MITHPPGSPDVAAPKVPNAGAAPAPVKTARMARAPKSAQPSAETAAPTVTVKQGASRTKKPAAAPAAPAAPTPAKVSKERARLVRDSFTMPEADFALIAALKSKAMSAQRHAKKSELLRAGLRVLSGLNAQKLAQTLDGLEPVKIGRPKKGHGVKK